MADTKRTMKCIFKDCDTMGEPSEGFDFFACEPCCERLEELIVAKVGHIGLDRIVARLEELAI